MSEDQRRLYDDLAWIWPIISPPRHHVKEAGEIRDLIQTHATREVSEVLHLGCGGGHLDATLKNWYSLVGVDLSPAMLDLARQLNVEVEYLLGDMRDLELGKDFDAVVVADSISYMASPDDLLKAMRSAHAHLRPGGVLVTYAEVTTENFDPRLVKVSRHPFSEGEVTLIETAHDADPDDGQYEMIFVYLIRRGADIHVENDRHIGGVFPVVTWTEKLFEAGFEVVAARVDGEGVPSFVGVRPG